MGSLNNAQIYAFAAYNLFTFPCFAAIATMKAESSKKAFPKTLLFWFAGSYVISLVVYLVGLAFQAAIVLGIVVLLALIAAIVLCGYFVSKHRNKAKVA